MYIQQCFQVDVPPVGGVRKSSGFNRHPGESAHHDPDPEWMLSHAKSKVLLPHSLETLGKIKDGFNWRQSGENYIESFVDNIIRLEKSGHETKIS